ncbi:heavy metal translocating P-type ATPase [Comamonas flocculans]|uniref:Cation-translocating P-type ATPase n=1 Tax=Comamonas flocculans TaxID=2597701 RepID=A0A5B8RXP6_9BURK|nr:cation-translocating P-type ATPase [Comamonas flocculans]QEA13893.1 cation-translocating P-type ATPase [Comamonas flocculans]
MQRADALNPTIWPMPGQHPASGAAPELSVLDERDEWQVFSTPNAAVPGQWESIVAFEGMHCAACAVTLEQLLGAVPGVLRVEVSAAGQRGRVLWDEQATRPSRWMQALAGSGYRALPVHDLESGRRRQAESRRMLWRLGVAGVSMMQVMMYAWPAYIAPGAITPDIGQLLRWAQWVLSLPVMLFSCRPFFSSAWRDLRARRIGMDVPVALGVLITFVVSSLGTFEPEGAFGHQVYFDSLTMFVFFLLAGRWLELRLRDRSAGALEALMHRLPETVERLQPDGQWQRVAARRVRPGDLLRVLPGTAFPADGEIVQGDTRVDEALLTGESRALARGPGEAVIAGSHNLSAAVQVRATAVGAQTRYAQIVGLMEQAASDKPDLARLADRIARPFLLAVLLIAALAGAWWWPVDPARALMVVVAVLVVTCPCALSLATPAAMLASAAALARRGVLVRRLQAIEALAQVDTVVFDKTGTLTSEAFALARVDTRVGLGQAQALALAAQLARCSLHPVSRALVAAAGVEGGAAAAREVREVAGQGLSGLVTDGDGRMLPCRLGSASFCALESDAAGPPQGPVCHLADENGWLASFRFEEALRPDARAVVGALHAQNLEIRLLSGDREASVQRMAAAAGIGLAAGDCTPDGKLRALQRLQQQGRRSAMVGDGLNDGPVLAAAHVSFAFGRAVPLAQARSDFVVLDARLMSIAWARAQALRTLRVVRQNLAWALLYNLAALPLAVLGYMPAWAAGLGMAASSLLVVANALRLNREPVAVVEQP